MTNSLRICLLATAALWPAASRAADVTQAQASEVEGQVRAWLAGMLGPSVPLANRPIQLTPAGDHFDVVVPFKPAAPGGGGEVKVTATARPLDGGKWSIDGIKAAPMPLVFTLDMPAPPVDGKPATPPTIPVTYNIDITGQDGQILFDPSLNSPSTYTSSIKGAVARAQGGPLTNQSTMGPGSTTTTLRPAGGDRVDVAMDGSMQDYRISGLSQENGPVDVGMKLLRVSFNMNGVSRTRAAAFVQNVAGVLGAIAAAPADTPPKIAPDLAKQMLQTLQDFATEAALEESVEGMTVAANGVNARLDKMRIAFGAKSDAGLLAARMELGAGGLALPGLDLGPMTELIPASVSLRPFVSGVGVAELTRLIQSAGDKKDPDPKDIAALFSHGGIVTGLESMSLVMGGATLTGQGKVTLTSPTQYSGTGQITAENFDALMEKISEIPQAAQGMPVLALVKGMARTVDDKLVWNVAYADNKLLVNNVDVMKMFGGGGGAPPPNRPRPNRPTK